MDNKNTRMRHKKLGTIVDARHFGFTTNSPRDKTLYNKEAEAMKQWLEDTGKVERVYYNFSDVSKSYSFTFSSWGQETILRWGDPVVNHPDLLRPVKYHQGLFRNIFEEV